MEALATLTGHAFGVLIPVTLAAICAAAMGFLAFSAWQSKLVHATGFKGDSTKDIKYAHSHPCIIACGNELLHPLSTPRVLLLNGRVKSQAASWLPCQAY